MCQKSTGFVTVLLEKYQSLGSYIWTWPVVAHILSSMTTSWKLQRMIAELTQREAARRAQVSIRRLSLIERGMITLASGSKEYDQLTLALSRPQPKKAASGATRTEVEGVGA